MNIKSKETDSLFAVAIEDIMIDDEKLIQKKMTILIRDNF